MSEKPTPKATIPVLPYKLMTETVRRHGRTVVGRTLKILLVLALLGLAGFSAWVSWGSLR